jgi:hypothetical protein
METGQKQPDSWELWKDASSVKHGVYGKNTPSGYEWHVLAQMPQASCGNGFASITHAILHASFGQYLALLTGWFAPLSETDAADRPADGQHQRDLRGREPDGEARRGDGGPASESRAAEA